MKSKHISFILCPVIFMFVVGSSTSAETHHRVNRYTLYALLAEPQEKDLLSAVVETTFPHRVSTVGAAIDYILLRSGYRHVPTPDIDDLLGLTLPQVHRSIGPLDVRTTIRTLVGDPWSLHEDTRSRVVWFQLAGAPPTLDDPTYNQEVPDTSNPEVSEPEPVNREPASQTWLLDSSKTLRQNLAEWTDKTDWSLEWNSHHDYRILHSAVYRGTLEEAVEALLEHYRTAPFALRATFFNGNSVLLIESSLVSGY